MFKSNFARWSILAVLSLAMQALPAAAQLEMQHIATPLLPTIDGDLSDWSGAADFAQSDFNSTSFAEVSGGVPESDQKVEVWVGWNDNTNLVYVAGRVEDDDFATNSTPNDPTVVWKSDGFEVFINVVTVTNGTPGVDRHQYVLNTAATQGVSIFPGGSANPMAVVAAALRTETVEGRFIYTYEMAIPGWTVLNQTRHDFQRDQTIGFRVAVTDFTTTAAADAGTFHIYNSMGVPSAPFVEREFKLVGPEGTGLTISNSRAGGGAAGRVYEAGIPGLTAKPVATERQSWSTIKKSVQGEE